MPDLSVLIPARNERWLSRTIEDVLSHAKGDTEIIVVLDGAWPETGYELKQHANVQVIYLPEAIGQRAATNLAARVSTAKYVMKLDAHCAVAEGFDLELMRTAEELGPDVTQIPAQYNLHIYSWKCTSCKFTKYQGPDLTECPDCKAPVEREIHWRIRKSVLTTSWRLDPLLHFQYDGPGQRQQVGDVCDVMSSLGACFFMSRERFWQLEGLDEKHGSWGNFGAEIALKSWLSGGRHVVNKRTWFAHFFRVGGIGFPYPIKASDQEAAKTYSRNLWIGDNWPKQVKPLRWLVEKFRDTAGWTQEQIDALPQVLRTESGGGSGDRSSVIPRDSSFVDHDRHNADRMTKSVTKGVVYYTDNECPGPIATAVREQLERVAPGPIVSVSLKPLSFRRNIILNLERGYLTMFRQILAGLVALDTDVAFLCEHDVLYPADHFNVVPPTDKYLYNQNVWKVSSKDGRALHYLCSQTSGLCANRQLLVEHYRKRVEIVEQHGFTRAMGFEPGTHNRAERVDDVKAETWFSKIPLVDIRHGKNLTPSRWKQEQFRNKKYCEGWTEADSIPGWGVTRGRFAAFLEEATCAAQQVA